MTTPTGKEALDLLRRIECSSEYGAQTIFHFTGHAFSRRAGEPDQRLFALEGMLIRQASDLHDEERGAGFHRLGREMMLIRDPDTGQVLDEWDNPWTGERVDVVQVANDHVNGRYFERLPNGQPLAPDISRHGPFWQMPLVLPIYRANPLGAGYEPEMGGMYHAVELFTFSGLAAQLDDPEVASVDVAVTWSRMSDWFPWMRMNGREGMIYVHTTGSKLSGFEALPADLIDIIDTRFPAFRSPPPVGDDKPMDTSWTEYRVIRETGHRWFEEGENT